MTATNTVRDLLNRIPKVSPLDGVSDPTGRVDLAVSRILAKVVSTYPDPTIRQTYCDFKPVVDTLLVRVLGPATPNRKGQRKSRSQARVKPQ